MTKEECIGLLNRYAEYNGMGIPNLAGCRDAMRTAAELLQQPSLPSNLDEAAEEIASDIAPTYPDVGWDECFEKIKEGIKAGAEWMAGQGETIEKTVGQLEHMLAGNTFFTHGFEIDELDVPFLNSKEVGYGDKVIVQIRKV